MGSEIEKNYNDHVSASSLLSFHAMSFTGTTFVETKMQEQRTAEIY